MTIGEKSIPIPKPILLRTGFKTGSVTARRNLTTGLYGSGFTQLINAEMITSHIYIVKRISVTLANANNKLPIINIYNNLPSSLDLFSAASITDIIISFRFFSSQTFNPSAVVPAGDVTISLSFEGCSPVSSSFAVPINV